VPWLPAADLILLSACVADGIGLFLLPAAAAGLTILSHATVDGLPSGDLLLTDVQVPAGALLGGRHDVWETFEMVFDRAVAAQCADAVGAMAALLDATVDYAKTRVQFGQPIGKFQALQHRMAEMFVLLEESRALALLAALKADAPQAERSKAASGAKSKITRAARHIAHEAVQMHGAMGVTEELSVGQYFKRLLAFSQRLGSDSFHRDRYAALCRDHRLIGRGLLQEAKGG